MDRLDKHKIFRESIFQYYPLAHRAFHESSTMGTRCVSKIEVALALRCADRLLSYCIVHYEVHEIPAFIAGEGGLLGNAR